MVGMSTLTPGISETAISEPAPDPRRRSQSPKPIELTGRKYWSLSQPARATLAAVENQHTTYTRCWRIDLRDTAVLAGLSVGAAIAALRELADRKVIDVFFVDRDDAVSALVAPYIDRPALDAELADRCRAAVADAVRAAREECAR